MFLFQLNIKNTKINVILLAQVVVFQENPYLSAQTLIAKKKLKIGHLSAHNNVAQVAW